MIQCQRVIFRSRKNRLPVANARRALADVLQSNRAALEAAGSILQAQARRTAGRATLEEILSGLCPTGSANAIRQSVFDPRPETSIVKPDPAGATFRLRKILVHL
jgi:hypothetical protein